MPKSKSSPAPVVVVDEAIKAALPGQIDELGLLDRELSPWRSKISRETKLKAMVQAAHALDPTPATEEIRVNGTRFYLILGERHFEQTIGIKALVKAIGAKAYSLFAVTTLKAIEANVSDEIAAPCITRGQTGSRTLKVFELSKVPAAAAMQSPTAVSDQLLDAA